MSVARAIGGKGTDSWLKSWTQNRFLIGDPAELVKL